MRTTNVARWSITDVVRLTGLTSRTLRHYDAIGLLPPAHVGDGGRRHYALDDLLRLQQIMLLRRLGVGLREIGRVVDAGGGANALEALERHRAHLEQEDLRIHELLRTVDRTIDELRRGGEMTVETMFEGFEHNPYEDEARERWGDDVVDASKTRMAGWSANDAEKARTGYTRVHELLGPLHDQGVPVDDDRVQAAVQLHYDVTCLFWTPTAEAYRGLGQQYVADERYHQGAAGASAEVVAYLRDAMAVYADRVLEGA